MSDPAPEKLLVVLVEDSRVLRLTYQNMFAMTAELHDYRLVMHEGAWKALEWLNQLPEVETPALFILDWMMEGMNGLDLLVEIRKNARWRETPVIMATSASERGKVMLACSKGATDYIVKPIQSAVLVKKLRKLRYPSDRVEGPLKD